ncbi:ribonuclease P protein component [Leptospira ognonensis]|uniref:Ribonuclease P protein component n=1 Tax=Leptospira ognonensis TaxID=2484945 RepID=A0A4R9JX19_9LEPT|nr:ribonuclease P protein component [Leptospira ognonensis]TGL56560.1 ribonuclease P protein component [Leptospira ognonensis]
MDSFRRKTREKVLGERPSETLCDQSRIQELFRNARKTGKKPLLVLFRKNGLGVSCFLFCPDKSHKRSVDRNKTKRILRELVRNHETLIPKGFDIAILSHIDFSKIVPEERKNMFLTLFANTT